MARRNRQYSPEFRAEAVRLARAASGTMREVADELGVNVSTLRAWVTAGRPQPDVPLTDDERSELKRLRRENRILREEREILKKATAFFATHSE
jgi:transposase